MKYSIILVIIILNVQNIYSESRELQPFGTDSAIAIDDNVLLYKEPTISSESIARIPHLQGVRIIAKTNVISSGKDQLWYYVDSGMQNQKEKVRVVSNRIITPTLKGWVQREDLAGWGDFKPADKIQEMFIICYEVEGPPVYYSIYPNGTYKISTEDKYYYSESVKIHLNGKVYRYKNVLLLTGKAGEVANLFYYDYEGKLRGGSSWETKVITNKAKFLEWKKFDILGILCVVTGDNVNVRTEPNTNATVLLKLKKGAKVVVINRQDEEVTIGDKTGHWAYIDTGVKDKKGNTIKGWVFDVYLKEAE